MIAAYSPEARGRSERAFGTHQGRLPFELAAANITDMATAKRYLREVYLPAFNAEFSCQAAETGSVFVPWIGGNLNDILCEQHERTVSAIAATTSRRGVGVHRYDDSNLAVFHGPRNRRLPDQATLTTEVNAWQLRRNMEQREIKWAFTRQDADTKMDRYYVS